MLVLVLIKQKTKAWPKYWTIFGWMNDFKRIYKSLKFLWEHEIIRKYPADPRTLPASIFAAAYGDGDPVTKELQGFTTLADHVPLRKHSVLLVRET